MPEAVIVSAVRTPVGRAPKGMLATTRPDDLASIALSGALERVPSLEKSEVGDVILGLASTGLHTNGYSLARKLFFEIAGYTPDTYVNEIKGKVGNELMQTHRSYWPVIKKMLAAEFPKILGGFIEEARKGGCAHMKLTVEWLEPAKDEGRQRKGSAQRLLEELGE